MSSVLDQIKLEMLGFLSKAYREQKPKMNTQDWNEFQAFYWKIRSLLPSRLEFPGPTLERVTETPAVPTPTPLLPSMDLPSEKE